MPAEILIKGGRVIDPASGIDDEVDIFISGGKIQNVSKNLNLSRENLQVIDASGKLILPGLVDMHVHLRDPGPGDEETIISGTRAAVLGGFTSLACMANTHPPADNPAIINYIVSKARSQGLANVFPVGAVTRGLKGKELAEMGRMRELGAVAFSDDGRPVMDSGVLRKAFEYSSQFKVPLISHSEDLNLSSGGVMNEGYLSTVMGLKGIPKEAEENAVSRDILILKSAVKDGLEVRLHIAHVSTAGAVEIIRRAKEQALPLSCETAPHYFTLTEEEVEGYNTNAKLNPPLRTEKDVAAIVAGLKDGTIDCIASDHAPHKIEEKNVEFGQAAFGIVGLETALALVLTELVETNVLSLTTAVSKLTVNPAKILGINRGTLSAGAVADITIIDPHQKKIINVSEFASMSKNSPFDGWKVKGTVETVLVSGKIVVSNGSLVIDG